MIVKEIHDFHTIDEISDFVHKGDEEIMVQKDGKDDFVMLNAQTYKKMQKDRQVKELIEAALKARKTDQWYEQEDVEQELDAILNV